MRFFTRIIIFLPCAFALAPEASSQPPAQTVPAFRQIEVFGGAGIPLGGWASGSSSVASYAKLGGAAGFEFVSGIGRSADVGFSVAFGFHPYDETARQNNLRDSLSKYTVSAGSFLNAWLTGSIGLRRTVSSGYTLYGRIHAGVCIGRLPEIREDNITRSGSGRATHSSATAVAPGFGASAGVVVENSVDIGIRFLYAEPRYEVPVRVEHGLTITDSYTDEVRQPSPTVQCTVGYIF